MSHNKHIPPTQCSQCGAATWKRGAIDERSPYQAWHCTTCGHRMLSGVNLEKILLSFSVRYPMTTPDSELPPQVQQFLEEL